MCKKNRGISKILIIFMLVLLSACSKSNTTAVNNTSKEPQSQLVTNTFTQNRTKLATSLSNNSILVLFSERDASDVLTKNKNDSPNRNLYYISGIKEQASILMLVKKNEQISEFLYTSMKSDEKAIKEMKLITGINTILELSEFEKAFENEVKDKSIKTLYLDLGPGDNFHTAEVENLKNTSLMNYPHLEQKSVYYDISKMRMTKSQEEIDNIKKAIEITKAGITNMMKISKASISEGQLEQTFMETLKNASVYAVGFDNIIGSGRNTLELHYSNNNCNSPKDGLILTDVGAEYNFYSADITRTFPANGKFTDRQKQIYNIVLKAQEEVIKAIKPGVMLSDLQALSVQVLKNECLKLGLLKPGEDIRKYYMHGVSHHLGLDVHDATVPKTPLQPGMIITVEPGLYIDEEEIGIRIEDDILVTESGYEILSKDIIKTVEEIEKFMKK